MHMYRANGLQAFVMMVGLLMALLVPHKGALAQTVISPVPASIVEQYGLDTAWYNKYVDAWGLPILGSADIEDATLLRARDQLGTLLWTYPSWPVPALNAHNVRVVLTSRNERMSSIPEVYAAFGTSLDDRYWGGMGATPFLPLSVGTEANLMDNYGAENVFVHEFGHTLMDLALSEIDHKFAPELRRAYNSAVNTGLWLNTYAQTDQKEYWAEGIQSYFGVNYEGPEYSDGVHNNINTRTELYGYDRKLYDLIDKVYKGRTLP